MKYEVNKTSGKWRLYPDGNSARNQQSKILKCLMSGMKMTRIESFEHAGCIKLPSRVGEINEALLLAKTGVQVLHEKKPTKHGGCVYQYFLTANQCSEIENNLELVA